MLLRLPEIKSWPQSQSEKSQHGCGRGAPASSPCPLSCPIVPLSRCTSVLVSQCPCVPLSMCPNVHVSQSPLSHCPGVPLSWCPSVPVSQCPCVPVSRFPVSQSPWGVREVHKGGGTEKRTRGGQRNAQGGTVGMHKGGQRNAQFKWTHDTHTQTNSQKDRCVTHLKS